VLGPSPNFGDRRGGVPPSLIVLHFTAMDSCAAAAARLCDPAAEVSAHYLLDRDGTCHALVPEAARAWHAGAGAWAGIDDVNSHSIGIELQNRGAEPFAHLQMSALERLLADLMGRWAIPPERVIGHSDMAPLRKADPGPRFDWRRLAQAGLSVWPLATGTAPAKGFSRAAHRFGYPDLPTDAVLPAFRQRFRPWALGPLDGIDAGLAADLARRYPVDAARARA
jgi:N-acetylmuramoyl-L-alanine amidase